MMANCAPLGSGSKGTVKFKSICGILGFPVTGDIDKGNFSSVSFKGAGACGAGTLTCAASVGSSLVPNLSMTDGSTLKTVTISDTGTTSESTPVWYYMYLPPKTYTSPTVTVTFVDTNVEAVDRTVSSLPVSRNNITWAANYFQTLMSGGGVAGSQAGTEAAPYLIKTENDLRELAAKVNQTDANYATKATGVAYSSSGKYYKIVNNITLTSGYTPIGTEANPFEGILLGNNCTISGLTLSGASTNQGLFGVVSGASISDLTISSPSVTGGTSFIGALAGKAINSTISSVNVTGGTVSGSGDTIGGVIGLLNGGSISSCSTTVAVSGGSFVGGVIGAASAGSINSCSHNTGTVSGSNVHIGGVIGSLCAYSDGTTSFGPSSATISDCTLTGGTVSNSRSDNQNGYVGGVIGSTNGGAVSNCNSTGGTVSASGSCIVGGVIGELNGGATMQGTSDGSRGSNAATVSAYDYVGGVCGKVWYGTLKWYNNSGGTVSGHSYVGGVTGGTGAGGSCTVTYCSNSRSVSGLSNIGGCAGGFGSTTSSTGGINNCSNSGAVTTTNTNASNATNLGGCVGYSMANGNIDACSNTYAISTVGRNIGGIVGLVEGPTDIINCNHSKNVISTGYSVGGIVGEVWYSAGGAGIRNCYVTSITVQSTSGTTGECGGIAGQYYSPTTASGDITNVIYHCQTKSCTIQGNAAKSGTNPWETSCCGGIAGELYNNSRIIECSSKQNKIFGRACCGGIVGMLQTPSQASGNAALVRQCFSQNNWLQASATDNYNYLGGIVGNIYQENTSTGYVRITECISDRNYYESEYSSSTDWRNTCGGIAGAISGAGAYVAIRNSFVYYLGQTVSANPAGSGKVCFNAKNRTTKTAMGGLVGYFTSGNTATLRIYNTGSCCTYSDAFAVNSRTTEKDYVTANWATWGINPIIGRVYQGKVEMNTVIWTWPTAPFSCNTWSSSSITDVRSDNTVNTFNYHGTDASPVYVDYETSVTLNSSYKISSVIYYKKNDAGTGWTHTTKTDEDLSSYWSSLGHAPSQSKSTWTGTQRLQASSMLSSSSGYARNHDLVNEGMGYTGHDWTSTNGFLTGDNRWYPGGVWKGN